MAVRRQTDGATLEPKRTQPPDPHILRESSARENLIEHVFLGELLRGLWRKNVRDLRFCGPRSTAEDRFAWNQRVDTHMH